MAHLVTGYAGQAHIKSADEGAFNASFFGSEQYVMEYGNEFEGSIIDNNTVRIAEGEGLMYGRHFRVEAPEDLTITTGKAGTSRIDLICMTYEKNPDDETEKVFLSVIKGTQTAGTPSVPEYTDGNILEGASLNQMPLYKVKIEGVVLSKIEPMFETIPSYEGLAKMYADRFEAACEELKAQFDLTNVIKRTDVVDNFLSDATDLPASARTVKELNSNICKNELSSRVTIANNADFTPDSDGYITMNMDYDSTNAYCRVSDKNNNVLLQLASGTNTRIGSSVISMFLRKGTTISFNSNKSTGCYCYFYPLV